MTGLSDFPAQARAWASWQGHIEQAFARAQAEAAVRAAGSPRHGKDHEGHGVTPHHVGSQRGEAVAATGTQLA